jgi:hypothetical protein
VPRNMLSSQSRTLLLYRASSASDRDTAVIISARIGQENQRQPYNSPRIAATFSLIWPIFDLIPSLFE